MRQRRPANQGQAVCLGLVIVAEHGQIDQAMAQLSADGRVVLGEADDHRCAASVMTAIGDDEELLRQLAELPAILTVEVVFAQVLGEEEAA